MTKEGAIYKSYLLRLWWDEGTGLSRISPKEVKEPPAGIHF